MTPAPKSVWIAGAEVPIQSDFRTSIRYELMMQDRSTPSAELLIAALELYYDCVPEPLEEAVEQMEWFYLCGKDAPSPRRGGARAGQAVYSFEHDDARIYAAFLTQYQIDLQSVPYMHWWTFKGLFDNLSPETTFVKIMQYRSAEISPKMSDEQKKFYRDMKRLYALPLPKAEQQKLNDIEEALLNGGDVQSILGGDQH